jgi:hypothetical protein
MGWFSSDKECAQCVQHAQMHSGNWLGLGPANAPCPSCEDHAANGCPGINRKPGR